MPLIPTSHGPVAVQITGSGQPLVLLHANPGDSKDFDAIRPQLAAHYQVISLDWPGYGLSPAPTPPQAASAMLFAQVLQELMASLALAPAIVLGNSVGGYAAVRLALAQPSAVRGLVLVSTGGFTTYNPVTRLFCSIMGREAVNKACRGLMPRYYLRKKTPLTQQMVARAQASSASAIAVNAAVWRSFIHPSHDLRQAAQALAVPTLVISGKLDPVIPARTDGRAAAAAIPGAQHIVLNTGHAPFAEDPAVFMQALQPFLLALG